MANYGGESQMRFIIPSPSHLFTPGVIVLLAMLIGGYVLNVMSGEFAFNYLMLHPSQVMSGKIWHLATYSFITGCPWDLVFIGLIVLFLGSGIEREWRTGSFLLLWLVVTMACGLIWVIFSGLLGREYIGLSGWSGAYGIVGAFGLLFRGRPFFALFGTVQAQILALIFLAIGVILTIKVPIGLIWICGAGVAYLYIKLLWKIASGKQTVKRSTRTSGSFVEID